jgi:hypothetical protein
MDELKTQLNKYFVYLDENHTTSHVFVEVPCVDFGTDKDEDMRKTVYSSRVIRDDNDVELIFRSMVENNVLYSFKLQLTKLSIEI